MSNYRENPDHCRALALPLFFLLIAGIGTAVAQTSATQHTLTNAHRKPFLINNLFNYYQNDGSGSYNPYVFDSGFEFPKGSGKTMCYLDGVVWGGYHKGRTTPTVGGSVYRHGLQAGKILTYGTLTTPPVADDPTLPGYRVYRVRPDVHPGQTLDSVVALIAEEDSLTSRYESITSQQIFDQYIADWNEWPAADGAPFKDVDANGSYDPSIDIPGRSNADQTLWYVANDMDVAKVAYLAGSPPIGLEMQRTIWGYAKPGFLSGTVLNGTLLINKSGAAIDSMFLVQWADPDIGNASDDYAGWDGSRDLGYMYNGLNTDNMYGTAVPADGFLILQGPLVSSPGDTAIFKGGFRPGFRNLAASAFCFFTQGNQLYADPVQGLGGDLQWFRLMNGRVASNGQEFIDPITSLPTRFVLSGDPVIGSGWRDGMGGLTPNDRRICIVTGPFTMAAGDTQELVVAQLAGLAGDRLSSVAALKWNADHLRFYYRTDLGGPVAVPPGITLPLATSLEQNYPNPFNPLTRIDVRVKNSEFLILKVYDLLGREVATLLNEMRPPGTTTVEFDGSELASGVYLCRLQAGEVAQTRKLVLMR